MFLLKPLKVLPFEFLPAKLFLSAKFFLSLQFLLPLNLQEHILLLLALMLGSPHFSLNLMYSANTGLGNTMRDGLLLLTEEPVIRVCIERRRRGRQRRLQIGGHALMICRTGKQGERRLVI